MDENFRELLEAFDREGAKYLIGGYAVGAHGGAWHRRAIVDLNGYPAPVLSRDDLIASKLAAGRPQDLIDVERLRNIRNS